VGQGARGAVPPPFQPLPQCCYMLTLQASLPHTHPHPPGSALCSSPANSPSYPCSSRHTPLVRWWEAAPRERTAWLSATTAARLSSPTCSGGWEGGRHQRGGVTGEWQ
jgi:hypothetical protein